MPLKLPVPSLLERIILRKEEKFALLFMSIPAGIAMIAAVSLGSWPALRISMFLLFSFLAILMRRFGAAWAGIGLIMFMAYFTSLFFPLKVPDIRSDSPSIRSASSAFELKLFEREFLLRRLWDASASLFRKFPENNALREVIIQDVDAVQILAMQHETPLPPPRLEKFENQGSEAWVLIRDFLPARQNLILALRTSLESESTRDQPSDATAEPRVLLHLKKPRVVYISQQGRRSRQPWPPRWHRISATASLRSAGIGHPSQRSSSS